MNEKIPEIINQAAEQIGYFIALDPLSSQTLVDEIISEKNTITKLQKYISLSLNQMNFHTNPSCFYQKYIIELIKSVSEKIGNVPQDIDGFGKWLPSHIESTKSQIFAINKRLQKTQNLLLKAQQGINSFTKVSNNVQNLEEQLSNAKCYANKLKLEINNIQSQLEFTNKQKILAEQHAQEFENISNKLREDNSKLVDIINKKKTKIAKLLTKNMKLKDVILAFQNENPQTNVELRNEVQYLEKSVKKLCKLKKIHCGCFLEGTDWRRIHEDLHTDIERLKMENCQLKQRLIDFGIANKELMANAGFLRSATKQCCCCQCKCNCNKNDIASIRELFNILDEDMDCMRKEIQIQEENC